MFNGFRSQLKKPKTLGQIGEEMAQAHYKALGFSILEANFFNKKGKQKGEIDFIAKNNQQIIFVEVKTRSSDHGMFGTGAESVNYFKQQKLLKAVKIYLLQHPELSAFKPQIDVCVVIMDEFDKVPKSVTILANAVEDGSY